MDVCGRGAGLCGNCGSFPLRALGSLNLPHSFNSRETSNERESQGKSCVDTGLAIYSCMHAE